MHPRTRYLLLLLVIAFGVLLPAPATLADNEVRLITSGLDSPRGIDFIRDRAVVAEAGHGGPQCFTGGPNGTLCAGDTSQISWVNTRTGSHVPLAKGFFSVTAGPDGTLGFGGLAVRGGKIFGQIGFTSREAPSSVVIGQEAGHLVVVDPRTGSWQSVASVGDSDFDFTLKFTEPTPGVYSPGTQEHDANPTGVVATRNGFLVADSGANTLTAVSEDGNVTVLHHFEWRDPNPNDFTTDEVPTCLARTEGTLWIGSLSGHLFKYQEGQVTQVVPRDGTGHPLLSHVTGCIADPYGSLYIVNMFGLGNPGDPTFNNGNVVRYRPQADTGSVLADAVTHPILFLPYMDIIGPDGNLYVTSGATCPADGSNPIPGEPNLCTLGNVKGGRVVMIKLSHGDD